MVTSHRGEPLKSQDHLRHCHRHCLWLVISSSTNSPCVICSCNSFDVPSCMHHIDRKILFTLKHVDLVDKHPFTQYKEREPRMYKQSHSLSISTLPILVFQKIPINSCTYHKWLFSFIALKKSTTLIEFPKMHFTCFSCLYLRALLKIGLVSFFSPLPCLEPKIIVHHLETRNIESN